MTEPPKKPPFEYRVVPDGRLFAVVCVHNDTPDWWHVVARFGDQGRADSFCEIESMMASDFWLDDIAEGKKHQDDIAPPVASIPTPQTAVRIENFRPPTPAEKARVGTALVHDAAAEIGGKASIQIEAGTDWDKVDAKIRELWPTDLSVAEIARQAGCSTPTVHKHARQMGLPSRGAVTPPAAVPSPNGLSQNARDLWLYVSNLEGEAKQSEIAALLKVDKSVINNATAELITAGILDRDAEGRLQVIVMHAEANVRGDAEEPEEPVTPPTGCILNGDECKEFAEMWNSGATGLQIGERFLISSIEVADIRRKLNLPSRVKA